MKYPQGYLFLEESTQLPVLSTVQAWFTAKTEIYLPGVSPKSKLLDDRVAMLAGIHGYITKAKGVGLNMGCIVFNDTKLSQTFMLAHSTDIKKIYWIDSAEKARDIKKLDVAIRLCRRFDAYVEQFGETYYELTNYIFKKTGQTMVGDQDIERFIMGRAWGSVSEAEIHIRQIAKNETRAGVLVRLDLGAKLEESNHAEV
jgi:hypothetical protein